jgi:putative RNA 2'-phosphotransferase
MADPKRISKRLSYWLRHRPGEAGLELDPNGWAPVADVLAALASAGLTDRLDDLKSVVAGNDKQRFEFSPDGARIRARQGHSIDVELDWPAVAPPATLYHGTVERFLGAILAEGLRPMKRHHVHLSPDVATAQIVGARRGEAVILEIAAGAMAAAGHVFYLTGNGVWLTDAVEPRFIRRLP